MRKTVGCRPPGGNIGDSRLITGKRVGAPVGYRRPITRWSIGYHKYVWTSEDLKNIDKR